jgi:putative transposase
MDGCGRALDNIFVERLWRSVKYEDIYLKNYASMPELLLGLAAYFVFYNGERAHQSLSYKTPNEIYDKGEGGGAQIADHFRDNHEIKTGLSGKIMGQRQSAATTQASS